MIVSLFVACYNDVFFPQTGKAVVTVLERLGHVVEFPAAQTCCGQLHYNAGYHAAAAPIVRACVKALQRADLICVPSTSCVAMMREHFPAIARASGDDALCRDVDALLPRVFEFCELLVDKLHTPDVGACYPRVVTCHASCHSLRSIRSQDKTLRLLQHVRGLTLVELADCDECCGFGGTFAVKNAQVSAAMLADKVQCILDTQAEVCTASDNSCLMHIGGALNRTRAGVRCLHVAEILAATGTTR